MYANRFSVVSNARKKGHSLMDEGLAYLVDARYSGVR